MNINDKNRHYFKIVIFLSSIGMKKLTDISETGKTSSGDKPISLSSFSRTFARNLKNEIDKEMKK